MEEKLLSQLNIWQNALKVEAFNWHRTLFVEAIGKNRPNPRGSGTLQQRELLVSQMFERSCNFYEKWEGKLMETAGKIQDPKKLQEEYEMIMVDAEADFHEIDNNIKLA